MYYYSSLYSPRSLDPSLASFAISLSLSLSILGFLHSSPLSPRFSSSFSWYCTKRPNNLVSTIWCQIIFLDWNSQYSSMFQMRPNILILKIWCKRWNFLFGIKVNFSHDLPSPWTGPSHILNIPTRQSRKKDDDRESWFFARLLRNRRCTTKLNPTVHCDRKAYTRRK